MTLELNFAEKDIEDFLCFKDNLQEYLGLKYIKRQFPLYNSFVDVLAYKKEEKCFYIIELKKDKLDSRAFVQALKYYKLFKIKYKNKHNVKILLIGRNLEDSLLEVVEYFGSENILNLPFLYTLYDFTFKEGVSFSWYDRAQAEISKILKDAYLNRQTVKEI